MFEFIRKRAAVLVLFHAAFIYSVYGNETCMARVSTCTADGRCPIENAQFSMSLAGYLEFAQYATGEYGVIYPCALASSQIYVQAPGCPAVVKSLESRLKVHLNCHRECGDRKEKVKILDIKSSCQNDLTGLGLSVGPDIKNSAFLSDGRLYIETHTLPFNVAVYHPDHAPLDLMLTATTSMVELQCKVNGGWGTSIDSPCSQTCGNGAKTRTRSCDQPAPVNGGLPCTGPSGVIVACNSEPCPGWGTWVDGSCSQTCGTGSKSRTRQCHLPSQGNTCVESNSCIGESEISVPCNTEPCPAWGPWMDGQCSKTCGTGTQTRTRVCDNTTPCVGDSEINVSCNTDPCPAWGPWVDGACSQTCGPGTRTRTRVCDPPDPADACDGDSTVTEPCITALCTGEWLQWSPCTCNAPPGTAPARRRTRPCIDTVPPLCAAPCNPNDLVDYEPGCTLSTTCVTCTTGCCTGSTYELLDFIDEILPLQKQCESLGGKLLEINCAEELTLINAMITAQGDANERVFLGMTRLKGDLIYLSNREPVTFTGTWATDEPNDSTDCFEIRKPAFNLDWRDDACDHNEQGICEFE